MVESVLGVIGDLVPLLMGPLIAGMGWFAWRRPDEAPALALGGPIWVVRCWALGFAVLGITVTALGGLGLMGHEEPVAVGLLRMLAVGVVTSSMVVAAVFRMRRRRTVPAPPGSGGG